MTGPGDGSSGWSQIGAMWLEPDNQYFVGVEWSGMPQGDRLRFFVPPDAGPYATDSGWMAITSADEIVQNSVGPAAAGVSTTLTVLYEPAAPVTIGPYLGTLESVPSSPPPVPLPPAIPAFARWFGLDALDTPAEVQVGAQCDDVPLGGDVRWIVRGAGNDDIPPLDSGWQPIESPSAAITQQASWPAGARALIGIYYRPSPAASARPLATLAA